MNESHHSDDFTQRCAFKPRGKSYSIFLQRISFDQKDSSFLFLPVASPVIWLAVTPTTGLAKREMSFISHGGGDQQLSSSVLLFARFVFSSPDSLLFLLSGSFYRESMLFQFIYKLGSICYIFPPGPPEQEVRQLMEKVNLKRIHSAAQRRLFPLALSFLENLDTGGAHKGSFGGSERSGNEMILLMLIPGLGKG